MIESLLLMMRVLLMINEVFFEVKNMIVSDILLVCFMWPKSEVFIVYFV